MNVFIVKPLGKGALGKGALEKGALGKGALGKGALGKGWRTGWEKLGGKNWVGKTGWNNGGKADLILKETLFTLSFLDFDQNTFRIRLQENGPIQNNSLR